MSTDDLNPVTFAELRRANVARLPTYRNARGEATFSDVNAWSPAQWLMALVGEVGEAANILKKVERGDYSLNEPGVHANLSKELADIQCYLDLLALRCGIDLGQATVDKFNEVSVRVGSDVRLVPRSDRFVARQRGLYGVWWIKRPAGLSWGELTRERSEALMLSRAEWVSKLTDTGFRLIDLEPA